ncbi:MAG: hypothetical protein AMK72_01105 [Planctomycetes bacterium SM23_25]|jgi:hypothetical protein|nr:MAG: hypothetical protein AMK72_01105 [Planctomycetes bacterium SM23_25]
MKECYDSIRFSLSDLSGQMRFQSFDLVDMPDCEDVAASLREYLVRCPLAEVDVERIRSMECDDRCTCLGEVARVVREQQRLFGRTDPPRRT